jgi:hypothetical protein
MGIFPVALFAYAPPSERQLKSDYIYIKLQRE